MYVKPAPGRLVRDPTTKIPIPANGKEVPENSFWVRRLRDGDVEKAEPPAPPAPAVAQVTDSGQTHLVTGE